MMKSVVILAAGALVATSANAAPAPTSFAQCSVCHTVSKGAANGIGPNLYGVIGKKAGGVKGYAYSSQLKAAKLVWDAKTLDTWLANPMKLVPGTKMAYMGQTDAKKRAEIAAYLKGLR